MKNHACRTYLNIDLDGANVSREEFEELLLEITSDYRFNNGSFVVGFNDCYDVDVNEMIRKTIKDFIGKEEILRKWQKDLGVAITLEIVPEIVANSETPNQILSLDKDIVAFLFKSDAEMDMDYYVY